jgi:hypothetical protein
MLHGDSTRKLATRLAIDPQAIEEAIRRGLFSLVNHRKYFCWRFGDSRNASFRRFDGEPFCINGQAVKAVAETCGESWHRLIGLADVSANNRRDILVIPEGSKDALAALHFAAAEGTLMSIGVVMALGAAINLHSDDIGEFRNRRVRIIADSDQSGTLAAIRIAEQLAPVAMEVQNFSLMGLERYDGVPVKDLFDLTRIDYDDFEANRDLWSITDLDSKGERVQIVTNKQKFFLPPLSPPLGSPESHGFPVYPVSNTQELAQGLGQLAIRNSCTERNTARKRRWKLVRDLVAVEKRISRKLAAVELIGVFKSWYVLSRPHLDPNKTRDDYCGSFLAEFRKVRVPTGEGEALELALSRLPASALPEIPGMPDAPEHWRTLAALHRELARQSASGTYFLSCRDAARAHASLNKDSANTINHALAQLGVIKVVRIGVARPGGKASEFRYLLATAIEPPRFESVPEFTG